MSEPGDAVILRGIAASPGVVVGPAVVLDDVAGAVVRRRLRPDECDAELGRFRAAVDEVQEGLRGMIARIPEGRHEAAILEAYLLMVGDELLAAEVDKQVRQLLRSAEWAVASAIRVIALQLGAMDDPYMRERSHDIEFVGQQLSRALASAGGGERRVSLSEPSIVVARDLSPADAAAMGDGSVLAIVTEAGSRTSHTAIMARALEIPAVVGVGEALGRVTTGDSLIVDALRGAVIVHPSAAHLEDAERSARKRRAMAEKLGERRDVPAATKDGVRVELHANIELPEEARLAIEHGAEGVGLYRTELLYVDRSARPSEEVQLEAYRNVVTAMGGRRVTLRTFDLGGDKFASSFPLPRELNPMLGLRAVRLALTQPAMLLEHLRAMVRASAFGPVRVMVPLVCSVDELREVRALLERARAEVEARGEEVAASIPLGAMIEVPAAAVTADLLAAEADFMSIGTNDLVQYALAVDRGNRALAHLASPYHPAVLRLIEMALSAGRRHACPVSVCGEMASYTHGALLLVGLGVRELSMEATAIPEIKEALSRFSLATLEGVARAALSAASAAEVEALLDDAFGPALTDLAVGPPSAAEPEGAQ